jgi:hypothetical protein
MAVGMSGVNVRVFCFACRMWGFGLVVSMLATRGRILSREGFYTPSALDIFTFVYGNVRYVKGLI